MVQQGRFVRARVALVILAVLLLPGACLAQDRGPLPPPLPLPVAAQASADTVAYPGCGGELAPVVNAAYEQEVVNRVNSVRAANGLPPLKRVYLLDAAARYHATDLAQDNYFDHDSYDRSAGELVLVCAWSARITTYYPGWSSLAENIAAGYATPAAAMDGWLNSDGHRANILSTVNWELGVGYYAGSGDYYSYWVQDFGRRHDVYPLIIDRDAAATQSQVVTVYIYGDWQEMRLRNDDGLWTEWQPFRPALSWTLAPGRGEHTVWAELRAGDRSATSVDSIFLDAAIPALGDLPDSLAFTYNLQTGHMLPSAYEPVVENAGSDEPLTWQLAQEGGWFEAGPTAGTTPASFRIEPTAFDVSATGSYTGTVTVTVVDPPGTLGSPQTISLQLDVVDRPAYYLFVPLAVR